MKMLDWFIQELNKLEHGTYVSGYTISNDLSENKINLVQSYFRLLAWSGFIGHGGRVYDNKLTYYKRDDIPTFLTVKMLKKWYKIPYKKEKDRLIYLEIRKHKVKKLKDVTI